MFLQTISLIPIRDGFEINVKKDNNCEEPYVYRICLKCGIGEEEYITPNLSKEELIIMKERLNYLINETLK